MRLLFWFEVRPPSRLSDWVKEGWSYSKTRRKLAWGRRRAVCNYPDHTFPLLFPRQPSMSIGSSLSGPPLFWQPSLEQLEPPSFTLHTLKLHVESLHTQMLINMSHSHLETENTQLPNYRWESPNKQKSHLKSQQSLTICGKCVCTHCVRRNRPDAFEFKTSTNTEVLRSLSWIYRSHRHNPRMETSISFYSC